MKKNSPITAVKIVKKCREIADLHTKEVSSLAHQLQMANRRTQDVAKAADNYMAAVVYWSDFMADHPDSEYYDKETEREYKRLTNAKWKAYDNLKKYIGLVFPAKK